jgi:hypothetical protein
MESGGTQAVRRYGRSTTQTTSRAPSRLGSSRLGVLALVWRAGSVADRGHQGQDAEEPTRNIGPKPQDRVLPTVRPLFRRCWFR